MMILAGHRAKPSHLPEQPLQGFEAAAQILRKELSSLLREIQEDRAGFEHAHRRALVRGLVVDDRGHAIVGPDLQELGLELIALADVDRNDLVSKPGLLEEHGDLVPVGRRPVIEIDHGAVSLAGTIHARRNTRGAAIQKLWPWRSEAASRAPSGHPHG